MVRKRPMSWRSLGILLTLCGVFDSYAMSAEAIPDFQFLKRDLTIESGCEGKVSRLFFHLARYGFEASNSPRDRFAGQRAAAIGDELQKMLLQEQSPGGSCFNTLSHAYILGSVFLLNPQN